MFIRYLILTFIFMFYVTQSNAEPNIEKLNNKNFDSYVKRLAQYPQVIQILEQTTRYKELSNGAIGLPDPILNFGVDNLPINDPSFDKFLPTSKIIGFKQKIPNYSSRKAKSAKQKKISAKQQLIADYTIMRLKAMLISMLANLHKVKQQEIYAKKQLVHYKALEEFFKGKLESGSSVYWRFSEIDVERSLVENKLNDLSSERDAIEAQLIRLVGEVPNITLPNITNINWNGSGDTIYPVLIAAKDIDIASKDVDYADAAFYPNYGINALYKQRDSGANFRGDDWFSAGITISIPLWYNSNQAPKLRAAKAEERSAKNAYNDAMRIWRAKLNTISSKRDAALRNINVFMQKNKALKEMISSAMRNYEAGETDFDTVLNTQINQLTIESQLAQQRAKHIILTAEFNSHIIEEKE